MKITLSVVSFTLNSIESLRKPMPSFKILVHKVTKALFQLNKSPYGIDKIVTTFTFLIIQATVDGPK